MYARHYPTRPSSRKNTDARIAPIKGAKTGELDKQVRRILANDEAVKQADKEQYGTVKLLEDKDLCKLL